MVQTGRQYFRNYYTVLRRADSGFTVGHPTNTASNEVELSVDSLRSCRDGQDSLEALRVLVGTDISTGSNIQRGPNCLWSPSIGCAPQRGDTIIEVWYNGMQLEYWFTE